MLLLLGLFYFFFPIATCKDDNINDVDYGIVTIASVIVSSHFQQVRIIFADIHPIDLLVCLSVGMITQIVMDEIFGRNRLWVRCMSYAVVSHVNCDCTNGYTPEFLLDYDFYNIRQPRQRFGLSECSLFVFSAGVKLLWSLSLCCEQWAYF